MLFAAALAPAEVVANNYNHLPPEALSQQA